MNIKLSVFKKFFFSYTLILILPFFIGILIYQNSVNLIVRESISKYTELLNKNMTLIESRLDEIHSIGEQINLNKNITTLINTNKSTLKTIYEYYDAGSSISEYALTNNLIIDYFVILDTHNRVVTPNYVVTNESFGNLYKYTSETNINFTGQYHYREFINIYDYKKNGVKRDVIFYVQSLPIGSLNKIRGTLLIVLDKNKFSNLFLPISFSNEENIYVLDQNNKLLFSSNYSSEIADPGKNIKSGSYYFEDEKEYLLCHMESGMGWTYYAKIPKTALLSSFDSLKFLLIYSSIIFVILTFIISIYFSNKNTKPLKEIISKIQTLKLLKQYPKRENEYNLIDNALVNLSNANIALRTTVENQTPIIVSNFYKQLVEGFFKTEKEYSSYTSFLNIDSSPDYVMEIIYIEGLESMVSEDLLKEANVIKAIIKDNFQQSNFKPLYYYDMNENSFAVIFSFSPYSQAVKTQLEAFQKNVKDKVLDEYNTLIYFSQSNKTNNLLEIHSLFNQAKQAIEQIKFNQTGYMIYYRDIPKDKDNFYYPIELEFELIGLIKSGETEALKSKLKEIFCENFKSRSLSTEKTFQLVNLMKGSVLREFRQKLKNDNLKNLIANLENTSSTDEIFNLIVRIKTAYSNMISSIKEKKKTDLRNDIILFIEKNYRDPNFSIIEAANHFNRSEAFMYQFFKDNFSHSFYSYLENLRIKAACGLIVQGKLTIKEISSKTGYSNDTTFRRAFKRIMHVTPTTYKNAVE